MKITDTIGKTPLIKIDGIYCKCEQFNPTGSIKDRIAYEMIKKSKSSTIVEVSSGNTAISTAFICSQLGKMAILIVPENTSKGKIEEITKYGGIVRYCKDINDGMRQARQYAKLGLSYWGAEYINQFANPANVLAQSKMALEIAVALKGTKIDAIVCGVGTGGTITALHKRFPSASLNSYILKLEGTSDGVALPLLNTSCTIANYHITKDEVWRAKNYLSTIQGVDVGHTSAANFLVAGKIKAIHKNILVIFHDAGWRY